MKTIGITGGVGSGKSEVLRFLEETYGAVVCEADKMAHSLQAYGTYCYEKIVEYFGEEILTPEVKKCFLKQMEEEGRRETPLLIIEAALLLEEHYEEICDELWYIYTEKDIRICRLKEARGYTEERCEEIMQNQNPDEVFRAKCDRVIDNSGSFEDTKRQIEEILKKMEIQSR